MMLKRLMCLRRPIEGLLQRESQLLPSLEIDLLLQPHQIMISVDHVNHTWSRSFQLYKALCTQ